MYHSDESLSRLLGSAHELLIRRLHHNLEQAQVPLTAEQFQVMCWLWDEEGVNQQQLAGCIRRNRGSVTRILDVLERKGLVCRKCDDSDRRVNKVCLTDEGRKWKDTARGIANQTLAQMLQPLDEAAQAQLRVYLKAVVAQLEEGAELYAN